MGCGASASTSYEAPSGPTKYERLGTGGRRNSVDGAADEPKRSGPKKANHWHFQEKHTHVDFKIAKKILEAYPETMQQQRQLLHQEQEVNDAQLHKWKAKKTYSKAPMKLCCGDCGDIILRLQDECSFYYCTRCWRASNQTIRFELCTKCYKNMERKGCQPVDRRGSEELGARPRRGSLKVAVASCGEEDGSPTPPSKLLEFGGHVLDERPVRDARNKRPLREVQQPGAHSKPSKNEYGIAESAQGFGWDGSAPDENAVPSGVSRRRRNSNGGGEPPMQFNAGGFVPPAEPSIGDGGIHPAARNFVPPGEPSVGGSGVHPAARGHGVHPAARGHGVHPAAHAHHGVHPAAMAHHGVHPAAMAQPPSMAAMYGQPASMAAMYGQAAPGHVGYGHAAHGHAAYGHAAYGHAGHGHAGHGEAEDPRAAKKAAQKSRTRRGSRV